VSYKNVKVVDVQATKTYRVEYMADMVDIRIHLENGKVLNYVRLIDTSEMTPTMMEFFADDAIHRFKEDCIATGVVPV
jgi:hypothetical protein